MIHQHYWKNNNFTNYIIASAGLFGSVYMLSMSISLLNSNMLLEKENSKNKINLLNKMIVIFSGSIYVYVCIKSIEILNQLKC